VFAVEVGGQAVNVGAEAVDQPALDGAAPVMDAPDMIPINLDAAEATGEAAATAPAEDVAASSDPAGMAGASGTNTQPPAAGMPSTTHTDMAAEPATAAPKEEHHAVDAVAGVDPSQVSSSRQAASCPL
jgi:hypothetical protein